MPITLNDIQKHKPCKDGWVKLLRHLGKTKADDEGFSLLVVLESNGILDTFWCLIFVADQEPRIRKLMCDYALHVRHLWDMPTIVRQYLETQDNAIREEASAASYNYAFTDVAYSAYASAYTSASACNSCAYTYAAFDNIANIIALVDTNQRIWQEQKLRELIIGFEM